MENVIREMPNLEMLSVDIPQFGVWAPICSEPARSGDSSWLWLQGSIMVLSTLRTWAFNSTSTGCMKLPGAGGYGALCLDKRIPLRISLKNPSPPY